MEKPDGCSKSFRVSFIEDESFRPNPESRWLYEVEKKNGDSVVGVAESMNNAIDSAAKEMR